MSHKQPHFVTLTPELARELIAQMQAVLDGDASYFDVTLLTDDGQAISLHLGGPDDE
jgi:hypothetical protein